MPIVAPCMFSSNYFVFGSEKIRKFPEFFGFREIEHPEIRDLHSRIVRNKILTIGNIVCGSVGDLSILSKNV